MCEDKQVGRMHPAPPNLARTNLLVQLLPPIARGVGDHGVSYSCMPPVVTFASRLQQKLSRSRAPTRELRSCWTDDPLTPAAETLAILQSLRETVFFLELERLITDLYAPPVPERGGLPRQRRAAEHGSANGRCSLSRIPDLVQGKLVIYRGSVASNADLGARNDASGPGEHFGYASCRTTSHISRHLRRPSNLRQRGPTPLLPLPLHLFQIRAQFQLKFARRPRGRNTWPEGARASLR